MENHLPAWPPAAAWAENRILCASAWSTPCSPAVPLVLRSLQALGTFAPVSSPPPWSLHLRLPEEPGTAAVIWLANGFQIEARNRDGRVHTMCGIFTDVHVLTGSTSGRLAPSLFSPENEPQRVRGCEWVDSPSDSACLVTRQAGPEIRFCLVAHAEGLDNAIAIAQAHLDKSPALLIADECSRRAAHAARYTLTSGAGALLAHATETLSSRIRPPRGCFEFRWSAASLTDPDAMNANHLYPLVTAWRHLDRSVASDILGSVLNCQLAGGMIPARLHADGAHSLDTPAWPLAAQSIALLWETAADADLLEFALPRLERYLVWALNYYDPSRKGQPCWQSAGESLTPETFDRNLCSADLLTLLLCEIDALLALCATQAKCRVDTEYFKTERIRLSSHLETALWHPAGRHFRDRYVGAAPIERVTLSCVFPAIWGGLPDRFRPPLLEQIDSPSGFRLPEGLPSWQMWETDKHVPPIQVPNQLILLEGLNRAGARSEAAGLARRLLETLVGRHQADGALPDNLRPAPANQSRKKLAPSSVPAAALAAAVLEVLQQQSRAGVSAGLRWLDRRRQVVLAGAFGAVAAVVLAVVLFFMTKDTMPASSIEALYGLARQHYASGNYDMAAGLCEDLLKATHNAQPVAMLQANALFAQGDLPKAEAAYRRILERNYRPSVTLLNLGLTLFRQGRIAEAVECYRKALDQEPPPSPEVTARAQTALQAIENYAVQP